MRSRCRNDPEVQEFLLDEVGLAAFFGVGFGILAFGNGDLFDEGIAVGEAEEIKGGGVGIDGVRMPQRKEVKGIGDDARLDVDARRRFLEAGLLDQGEKRLIGDAIAFRILGQNIAMAKRSTSRKRSF